MSQITPNTTLRQRQPRVVDTAYTGWMRKNLGCVICAKTPVEVAHLRYSDALYLKDNPGMGAKPSDLWTLPLCAHHHRLGQNAQHNSDEKMWWRCWFGRLSPCDPHALCLVLRHLCYPDTVAAEEVLGQWRNT